MTEGLVQALMNFAESVRNERHELTYGSRLCQQAARELQNAWTRVESLEKRLSKEGELTQLKRIAAALEQAALYGWGKVISERLHDD